MAQNVNLQYITYDFPNRIIHDVEQLDSFLSTYVSSTQRYNSLYYDENNQLLTVYTTETASVPATRTSLEALLLKYPNAPKHPQSNRNVALLNKGDLPTYNVEKDKNIRIGLGLPGQVLTVDPQSINGFVWRDLTTDVSSGLMNMTTDEYIRYFEAYDASGNKMVGATDTDIQLSVVRRNDAPTFIHEENQAEVTIHENGNYFAYIKAGFQWMPDHVPKQNTLIRARVMVNKNDGQGYNLVQGTETWFFMPMLLPQASITNMVQFCMQVDSAPWTLKIVAMDSKDTQAVFTGSAMSTLGLTKVIIEHPDYDMTGLVTAIKNTNQVIDPSPLAWTPISFDGFSCNTNNAVTLNNSTDFTANRILPHSLVPVVTLCTKNGQPGDEITTQIKFQQSTNGTWTDLDYGSATVSLRVGNDGTTGVRPAPFLISYTLLQNQSLRMVSTVLSRTGTVEVEVLAAATYFTMFAPLSTNSGINKVQVMVKGSTSELALQEKEWQDVPWQYTRFTTDNFTMDPSTTVIQNSEHGTYFVLYKCTVELFSTNPDAICNIGARIVTNAGSGYYEAAASMSTRALRRNQRVTVTGQTFMFMGYNFTSKIQVIVDDIGNLKFAQGDLVRLVPLETTVAFLKIEQTSMPLAAPGLLVYGSYYTYHEDLDVSYTTSTAFITKTAMVTSLLPKGKYRFSLYYEWSMSQAAVDFESAVILDSANGPLVATYRSAVSITNVIQQRSLFLVLNIVQGYHAFYLNWRTLDTNVTAMVKNVRMELYRVG